MDPQHFHNAIVELQDGATDFWTTYREMLINPKRRFRSIIERKAKRFMLPGTFLFVNLILALLIYESPIPTDMQLKESLVAISKEMPRYVLGTVLFLLLLKLFGKKISTRNLFSVFCYSSIIYVPFAVVLSFVNSSIGHLLQDWLMSVFSGHILNVRQILQPIINGSRIIFIYYLFLFLVFLWWAWLMFVGLGMVEGSTARTRIRRLGLGLTAYVIVWFTIFSWLLGSGAYTTIKESADYDKMRAAFVGDRYGEANMIALTISGQSVYLPELARYRANIISAASGILIFVPKDGKLESIITAIKAGKYREAELLLKQFISKRLLSRKDPLRYIFQGAANSIKEADSAYNSQLYSEAKDQQMMTIVSPHDVPFDLFP